MENDSTLYKVIANSEDEYAIWPVAGPRLAGWRNVGKVGAREDCVRYIREIDGETRGAVLRKRLEQDRIRC